MANARSSQDLLACSGGPGIRYSCLMPRQSRGSALDPEPSFQLGGPMLLGLYRSSTGQQRPQLVTACGPSSTSEASAPRKLPNMPSGSTQHAPAAYERRRCCGHVTAAKNILRRKHLEIMSNASSRRYDNLFGGLQSRWPLDWTLRFDGA